MYNAGGYNFLYRMTRYIHPDVKHIAENPLTDESIRLALVVKEDARSSVEERVVSNEGSVERVLPSGVLLVVIPQTNLSSLIDTHGIESISPDEQMEILV